jgi:hypothetical protein
MNSSNLVGTKFGLLTVKALVGLRVHGSRLKRETLWYCSCDCGGYITLGRSCLTSGTRSCGCLNKESIRNIALKGLSNFRHGYSPDEIARRTPEYRAWQALKTRCFNPKIVGYHRYGGRGITVCDRWINSFENFLADMGCRPGPEYSIDRFPNNDGNYEPSNCRWATRDQQAANKTKPRFNRWAWEKHAEAIGA